MTTWEVQVTKEFERKFTQTVLFISQDKPLAAVKFKKDLQIRIKGLSSMPFRNRQSIYSLKKNVRDFIFKGYTIIYEITDMEVIVFSIIKHQIKL